MIAQHFIFFQSLAAMEYFKAIVFVENAAYKAENYSIFKHIVVDVQMQLINSIKALQVHNTNRELN